MSNILILNTGLNSQQSQSNKLTERYVQIRNQIQSNNHYTYRDLNEQALPHLTLEEMEAWSTPQEGRSDAQQALAMWSDSLIEEINDQDEIIIGMPMYNMGVPSTFKAYIDRIARAGKTFRYTEKGPEGLLVGKKVTVLAARGGQYSGTPLDTQTDFIKHIFGLMGITDVNFVYAEGLNMGEELAKQAWQNAEVAMESLVAA